MTFNRRKFLQGAGTLALGSMVFNSRAASLMERRRQHAVGLQLFTVFGIIDDDVKGTLSKIAAIGYKEMESAFSKKGGYYGMTPKEFKAMVEDLGMTWKSHHVLGAPFKMPAGRKMPNGPDGKPMVLPVMRNLRDNMQELVDEATAGGLEYMVCANTPTDTLDDLKLSIETLNKTGEAAKKAGIQFCYHNHDMEFANVEGKIPYDVLLSETDKDNVKMELDLCWVTKAGKDPVELFKANPGRFPLWHVKDLDAARVGPAPVGSGVVDFKRIFEYQKTAGMKHFFVEHDAPKDAFASIKSSYDYITGTLKA